MENKNFSEKKEPIFLGKDKLAIISNKLIDCGRVEGPTHNKFQHYGDLKDE